MNAVATIPQGQSLAPSFTMSEMERIALAIAKGRLFGSDDPNAVLTLCMVAQAEGKHPGLVMQQYHIINGKPAKKAEAMLVDFLAAGGRVVWNTLDDECAEATFSHPQGGSATINWTLARATKAGLLNNPTWKKYPRQMLRSRVVSEGVRTVFPGATSGMYVPEEVADFDDVPRSDTPPTPQPQRARDLTPVPTQIEVVDDDHSGLLADLETAASQGKDALAKAWDDIGKDARKALADELPRLKALCGPEDTPNPANNDADPGESKADEIIAAVLSVDNVAAARRILDENREHIDAMLQVDKMRVEMKCGNHMAELERKVEAGA